MHAVIIVPVVGVDGGCPDMTFVVDWALNNNYLSGVMGWLSGWSVGLEIQRLRVRNPVRSTRKTLSFSPRVKKVVLTGPSL